MSILKNEIQKNLPIELRRREVECLSLLAQGMEAKQIAARLGLSPRTIHYYFERIYAYCGDRLMSNSPQGLLAYFAMIGIKPQYLVPARKYVRTKRKPGDSFKDTAPQGQGRPLHEAYPEPPTAKEARKKSKPFIFTRETDPKAESNPKPFPWTKRAAAKRWKQMNEAGANNLRDLLQSGKVTEGALADAIRKRHERE